MADNNIAKTENGGRYKYADIAHIHEWLEEQKITYYQYIERIEGDDYIYTVPTINGKELPPRRGCRVVQASLIGINNPAQEQGSALTYARRYSLLMAFGLATEDDDAQLVERPKTAAKNEKSAIGIDQVNKIRAELERTGINEATILALYGVKSIESMTLAHYENAMKKFEKTGDKKK